MKIPSIDFETYSEAGYEWNGSKWASISPSPPHGIGAVGAAVYAQHPSTRVLCLAYDMFDGLGPQLWLPGTPEPQELFNHILAGGFISAWNCMFEYRIWEHVCHERMGWLQLPLHQLIDPPAMARSYGLPGALGKAADAIEAPVRKITDGKRLIDKFSMPRKPTKTDPYRYKDPLTDKKDGLKLYEYCAYDVLTETAISKLCPPLQPKEYHVWRLDQKINERGVNIDQRGLKNCIKLVEAASKDLTAELIGITNGTVKSASELKKLTGWLLCEGVTVESLTADSVKSLLAGKLPVKARRALQIRQILSSASVKKLFAMARRVTREGRITDMFVYGGAERTLRFAGRGVQAQNLPSSGPSYKKCPRCDVMMHGDKTECPICETPLPPVSCEWSHEAAEAALNLMATHNYNIIKLLFPDVFDLVSGCLRGLLTASDGHDFICSDYSAIEAVVLACLAGEQWRIDVFRDHGMIYEMSASKISGVSFQEFVEHKKRTGSHHPLRKKIGKVAELASGYQGSVGAWKAFGADKHIGSDEKILEKVRAWREQSPNIVNFWYGVERAAHAAVLSPGKRCSYRSITYYVKNDVLCCRLPSGRILYYHKPRLTRETNKWGKTGFKLSFMGWNSDRNKGMIGWNRISTYGGKLTENIVQAVSRDVLVHAMLKLDKAGYDIILHIHDEIVTERRHGEGSIEEVEKIMSDLPEWAKDWPIRAAGGWRGKRFRKD